MQEERFGQRDRTYSALVRIRSWAARRLDLEAANDPQWDEASEGKVITE